MRQTIEDAKIDRRTVLRGAGAVAVSGVLAGCGGGDDGGDNSGGGDVPSDVSDYLSDANNFDNSVADETGSESVELDVGAGSNNLAFGPAAVSIDTGTQVTWSWTGAGGAHNVVDEDGTFDSGSTMNSGTYEYTFEESGTYLYYCTPHKASGMKGAVIVE